VLTSCLLSLTLESPQLSGNLWKSALQVDLMVQVQSSDEHSPMRHAGLQNADCGFYDTPLPDNCTQQSIKAASC